MTKYYTDKQMMDYLEDIRICWRANIAAAMKSAGIEPEGKSKDDLEFTPWRPLRGLPCPVPQDADVTVKFRDGSTARDEYPHGWHWGPINDYERPHHRDIVGYHVHKFEVKK